MVMTPLTEIRQKITLDKFTQMHEPQLPDIVHDGEVLDSDKDFRVHVLIGLVATDSHTIGYFIEFRQDEFRLKPDPQRNDRKRLFQVNITDVQ